MAEAQKKSRSISMTIGFVLFIWFLTSAFAMIPATYAMLSPMLSNGFGIGSTLLLSFLLNLTPIGWIFSFYWGVSELDWSFPKVLRIYGVFIALFFFYIFIMIKQLLRKLYMFFLGLYTGFIKLCTAGLKQARRLYMRLLKLIIAKGQLATEAIKAKLD